MVDEVQTMNWQTSECNTADNTTCKYDVNPKALRRVVAKYAIKRTAILLWAGDTFAEAVGRFIIG